MQLSKSTKTLIAVVLVFLTIISLLPMIMVLINSFKTHVDIVKNPMSIKFSAGLKNYSKAWVSGDFGRAIINSIVYSGCAVLFTLLVSAPCAYVIAYRKLKISIITASPISSNKSEPLS